MRPSWLSTVFGVAAAAFLAVFFLLPLAVILGRSVSDGAALSEVVSNPFYWQRLGFTTGEALLSTVLTVALGLPGALLFARYAFPGKRFLTAAFTIPFVMPTVVAGIGFLALFGPRGLTGLDLRNTLILILLAHVFYNYAIVVRVVGGFLEGAAPRLLEAAATLGAGAWRGTLRVSLPLALPALLASATLVFLFCFTSFGIILILAPSPGLATLEVEIYQLTAHLLELGQAAVLVVAQLLVIGLITLLYTRMQARLSVTLPTRAVSLPRPQGCGRLFLGLNLVLAAALILSPLAALAVEALQGPGGRFPSLSNLAQAISPSGILGYASLGLALRNSLLFAAASTIIAIPVGFAFAYAVVRGRWLVLDQLSLLPLATSPVTLGFGYLLTFPLLVTHPWGIPLAHALIAFPFVTRSLLPALRGLDPALNAAAATLGAGPGRVLRRIELPQLGSAMLTAASFAFAVSMGEFGATLLLVRPEYATLPVAIYDRLGRPGPQHYGAAMALALVLMLVTGAVMVLLQRRGRSEF